VQNNGFYTNKTLNLRGVLLTLDTPKVMGILNVTPDSFYDGGKFNTEHTIKEQVEKMVTEQATFIDVGGYSTRPGAEEVSEEEEARRVLPVIQWSVKTFPGIAISIDTFRASIARRAVEAGAAMVNDVSGGDRDPEMFSTVASLRVPYVLMHMRGTPATMTKLTDYNDLLKDITDYFVARLHKLHQAGVTDVIIDPGFGFAKNIEQNFMLLKNLDAFRVLGAPILAGVSRKSMIWKTLETDPDGALNGTTALNMVALMKGVAILRVHDVREAMQCIQLMKRLTVNQ